MGFGAGDGLGPGLGEVPPVGAGLLPGVVIGVGLAPGVMPGVLPGVGDANATPGSTTCMVTELRHLAAQQIVTVWSPAPMLRGTTMGRLTRPLASARNGKTWRVLRSWISPFWFVGTLVALTTTVSPAAMVDEDSESVGVRNAAMRTKLEMRMSTRAAAAAIA